MATVLHVCISREKGTRKQEVSSISVRPHHGIEGDAHAGDWHRQISLLAKESIDRMGMALPPGAFAENIVTQGIDLKHLPVGTVLRVGNTKLQVTQIGKQCHNDCEIKKLTGTCVMPTDGIFCVVLEPGEIRAGDEITVLEAQP